MNVPASCDIRVLLLGFTVPKNIIDWICDVDRSMPMQTHKLAWSLVQGLEGNGVKVDLLSSEPVSNYPGNPRIIFRYQKWLREGASWNVILPFINILGLKHLTRFLSCFFLLVIWLLRTRTDERRVILLHGVHSPFLYAALLLGKLFKVKAVAVVSDPPGAMLAGEGACMRVLRRFDSFVITNALRSMDGLIPLTQQLSKHLAPKVPSIVVEGILFADDLVDRDNSSTSAGLNQCSDFMILYAGQLKAKYGLELLLQAFLRLEDQSLRLLILGKGDYEENIRQASLKDPRIVFKGYCPQGEIKKLLNAATVLINPRPTNQSFTQYSFPSKTIEYMVSGRPVISTRLPGIPDDYFPYLYVLENETPEGLSELIMRIKTLSPGVLSEFGANAKSFILENKNEMSQGRRIKLFLVQLLAK
ncbi:MAG: glycosyltransferase [Bacteroidales bacterium]|jgi:glycosyltransferase involved in cell wall biosynthesis|nr:glycosyltransferase [Bacteroidales bacterium]